MCAKSTRESVDNVAAYVVRAIHADALWGGLFIKHKSQTCLVPLLVRFAVNTIFSALNRDAALATLVEKIIWYID